MNLHQSGRLAEAEAEYWRILSDEQDNCAAMCRMSAPPVAIRLARASSGARDHRHFPQVRSAGDTQNGDNDGSAETSGQDMSDDAGFRELEAQLQQAGFAAENILTFSEDPGNRADNNPEPINILHCHDNRDHRR
jgi:hypothetical protein